ncbi:MAG: nucleotidyltransferase family protein [Actinobacteria bacterium]|nr:nucleotidyltransferase family protein [Actinomycetota bacterium]
MEAVILAAGFGTRMKKAFPFTLKPLLPIKGKPLIQDQIEHLKRFRIKNFYINLHHRPEKITNFLGKGDNLEVKINYSFEEELLGTSGALNNFKKYLDKTFVVIYGDIFTRVNFNKFLKFHKNNNSQVSLLIHKTDHPEDSDLVEIDSVNRIINIHTSPHPQPITYTNFSSAAIYIIEPEVLQFLPVGPSDFMEDFFPILLKKGVNIYGYISNEYSKDMGTPKRYEVILTDIKKLNL